MAILSLARLLGAVLSLAVLAAAAYLLWSWQAGELVRDESGAVHRNREDWRLWTGLGLLAWSFVGGLVTPTVVARPDRRKTKAERGAGRMLESPTGSSLYVESHGPAAAPTIIFTHGWGMDSTFWRYAKQDLGDRFRLILWDLPGLGRSKARTRDGISLDAFARDLAAVLDFAGGQRAVLAGHSIGGIAIQNLIRNHPELQSRLAGVVLLNTTYTNPLRTMALSRLWLALQRPVLQPATALVPALQPLFWLLKWQSYLSGWSHLAHRIGFGKFVTRSQLQHSTLLFTRNPPGVLALGDLAMMRWDATGVLSRLRVPALVIGGDRDIVTKLEASQTIAEESELATLQVVHDVNHMGPMERADLYNQLIGDFALQVQPSATDLSPARGGVQTETRDGAAQERPPPAQLH